MDIRRFREEVQAEFGTQMEHATPEHMRRFLSRVYAEFGGVASKPRPLAIPRDDATNYEQVVNEFFARVLRLPAEEGVVLLWLFASEMFYSRLGEQYSQELSDLLTFEIPEQ